MEEDGLIFLCFIIIGSIIICRPIKKPLGLLLIISGSMFFYILASKYNAYSLWERQMPIHYFVDFGIIGSCQILVGSLLLFSIKKDKK